MPEEYLENLANDPVMQLCEPMNQEDLLECLLQNDVDANNEQEEIVEDQVNQEILEVVDENSVHGPKDSDNEVHLYGILNCVKLLQLLYYNNTIYQYFNCSTISQFIWEQL